MNDDNLVTLSFRVPADAVAAIEAQAAKAGMNRSEYLRARALSAESAEQPPDTETLLRHIIFMLARVHNALYMMPEMEGNLSYAQLRAIYKLTEKKGLEYLGMVDRRIEELAVQLRLPSGGKDATTNQ